MILAETVFEARFFVYEGLTDFALNNYLKLYNNLYQQLINCSLPPYMFFTRVKKFN
jgi:hypothetical protein